MPPFVQTVWSRLMSVGTGARYDPLATTSIRFLTSVATSVHHTLYAHGTALHDVCERIVVRARERGTQRWRAVRAVWLRRSHRLRLPSAPPSLRLLAGAKHAAAAVRRGAVRGRPRRVHPQARATRPAQPARADRPAAPRRSDTALFLRARPSPPLWRRDIEGSDADTRRRVCAELVRALCRNFGPRVSQELGGYVQGLLQEHGNDPSGGRWQSKDVAIFLVTALSFRAGSGALGVTQASGLVDIPAFHAAAIAPELAEGAAGGGSGCERLPLLKAAALKFVATFRAVLPPHALREALPLLPGLLRSRHVVIHTYAAHALERLLTARTAAGVGDAAAGGAAGGRALSAADVQPQLGALLGGLLSVLGRPASAESDYAMRAILRLCTCCGGQALAPHVGGLLEALKAILARVCANPSAPAFNHYLFETVAALVRETCALNPGAVGAFEAALFPPFEQVLRLDVAEFCPYVLQVFAQLLEAHTQGQQQAKGPGPAQGGAPAALSDAYRSLWPPLLLPGMWERRANVPALCRLVRAFVKSGEPAVASALPSVLGIFQKLLASKVRGAQRAAGMRAGRAAAAPSDAAHSSRLPRARARPRAVCPSMQATEAEGCALLGAVLETFPPPALAPYLGEVCRIGLTRWQSNRSRKYALCLCAALSRFVAAHGGAAEALVAAMDGEARARRLAARRGGRRAHFPHTLLTSPRAPPRPCAGLHGGTFCGFFGAVWLEHCTHAHSAADRSAGALALVRLVSEAPSLAAQPAFGPLLPRALDAAVALLERTETAADAAAAAGGARAGGDDEGDEAGGIEGEGPGYAAAYARLHHAAEPPSDPCAGVDVRLAFARGVQAVCAAQPGVAGPLISAYPSEQLKAVRRSAARARDRGRPPLPGPARAPPPPLTPESSVRPARLRARAPCPQHLVSYLQRAGIDPASLR